jgi:hypothetical protein
MLPRIGPDVTNFDEWNFTFWLEGLWKILYFLCDAVWSGRKVPHFREILCIMNVNLLFLSLQEDLPRKWRKLASKFRQSWNVTYGIPLQMVVPSRHRWLHHPATDGCTLDVHIEGKTRIVVRVNALKLHSSEHCRCTKIWWRLAPMLLKILLWTQIGTPRFVERGRQKLAIQYHRSHNPEVWIIGIPCHAVPPTP